MIDTYKAKNGIILGKMNLAELSSTVTSINTNGPGCYSYNDVGCTTPLNAYNQTRISGGTLSCNLPISSCKNYNTLLEHMLFTHAVAMCGAA